MSGAATAVRPREASRAVDPEVQERLQDPAARKAAADELRRLASTLGASLRRDQRAEPGQVAALQRAINLYTGGAKLEVDDVFGRHTERALRDVQAALRADSRVRARDDIGGGRAAGPTLNGLADALDSDAQAPEGLRDRFQRVHAQPNVTDPIGQTRVPRAVTRPGPTPPEETPRAVTRGDPEALSAARRLAANEHSPVGFDDADATALRERVSGLPNDARRRTLEALGTEVQNQPEASRGQFAATLLVSLDNRNAAELYERLAPRENQPGRLTPDQHLDAARALGTLEGNGREFAGSIPANALAGMHGAIRERALSPEGTDADRDAAANLRAAMIRRSADQPVDIRDPAQREALLADVRFARGGAGDDPIAARLRDSDSEELQRAILERLEKARPPTNAAAARAYREGLREVLGEVSEPLIPTSLGDRLVEPPAARPAADEPPVVAPRRRVAPDAPAVVEPGRRAASDAPAVRDRRDGALSLASLTAASPDLGIPHYVQPDGSTCIPTTHRMIRAANGHIGRERVGNNEAVRFDGALLQRVLTQVQTTGIQVGVRSRNSPGGSIRGSESGHVVALTGYQFVNAEGRRVTNADVQAAVAATGGDWNQLLGALDRRGIRLRLNINDPGINSQSPGARSYLDVAPNGLISRPAIGSRYVSLGHYTVRYFMLD